MFHDCKGRLEKGDGRRRETGVVTEVVRLREQRRSTRLNDKKTTARGIVGHSMVHSAELKSSRTSSRRVASTDRRPRFFALSFEFLSFWKFRPQVELIAALIFEKRIIVIMIFSREGNFSSRRTA